MIYKRTCPSCMRLFETNHSKRRFCCTVCFIERPKGLPPILKQKRITPPGYSQIQKITKKYREKVRKCEVCNFSGFEALQTHHADQDRENNNENNLIVLCCNCHTICHSITGTFKKSRSGTRESVVLSVSKYLLNLNLKNK